MFPIGQEIIVSARRQTGAPADFGTRAPGNEGPATVPVSRIHSTRPRFAPSAPPSPPEPPKTSHSTAPPPSRQLPRPTKRPSRFHTGQIFDSLQTSNQPPLPRAKANPPRRAKRMKSRPRHGNPCPPIIPRDIRPRWPHRHPPASHPSHHRPQPAQAPNQLPSPSAIIGNSGVVHRPALDFVIPTHHHSMPRVPNRHREDPRRLRSSQTAHRNRPGSASIRRPQNPPRPRSDPNVSFPLNRDIRSAGCKRALPRKRPRHFLPPPIRTPIGSQQQHKFPIHRITHRDPMRSIPKRHCVIKRLRIRVLKLQLPSSPRIPCLVNPRSLARPNAQRVRGPLIHRVDVPKIQLFRSWNRQPPPSRPPIGSPQNHAAGPARPRHPFVHRAGSAKPRRNATDQNCPIRLRPRQTGGQRH